MAASPKPARAAPRASRGARGFERRPWGGFQTLVTGVGYKVKRLVVQPGHRISLQRRGLVEVLRDSEVNGGEA
jgi:mannose-6-phosphate isomerase-like protein (cupin superfamily)